MELGLGVLLEDAHSATFVFRRPTESVVRGSMTYDVLNVHNSSFGFGLDVSSQRSHRTIIYALRGWT